MENNDVEEIKSDVEIDDHFHEQKEKHRVTLPPSLHNLIFHLEAANSHPS